MADTCMPCMPSARKEPQQSSAKDLQARALREGLLDMAGLKAARRVVRPLFAPLRSSPQSPRRWRGRGRRSRRGGSLASCRVPSRGFAAALPRCGAVSRRISPRREELSMQTQGVKAIWLG